MPSTAVAARRRGVQARRRRRAGARRQQRRRAAARRRAIGSSAAMPSVRPIDAGGEAAGDLAERAAGDDGGEEALRLARVQEAADRRPRRPARDRLDLLRRSRPARRRRRARRRATSSQSGTSSARARAACASSSGSGALARRQTGHPDGRADQQQRADQERHRQQVRRRCASGRACRRRWRPRPRPRGSGRASPRPRRRHAPRRARSPSARASASHRGPRPAALARAPGCVPCAAVGRIDGRIVSRRRPRGGLRKRTLDGRSERPALRRRCSRTTTTAVSSQPTTSATLTRKNARVERSKRRTPSRMVTAASPSPRRTKNGLDHRLRLVLHLGGGRQPEHLPRGVVDRVVGRVLGHLHDPHDQQRPAGTPSPSRRSAR